MLPWSELFSRNIGLLTSKQQAKIRDTLILLIGCGLGSQIATLAARTGFTRFLLCDGDIVEFHNLNRQAFDSGDLGGNKAEVTRKKLLQINPACQIETCPEFVKSKQEIERLISQSDLIINMADPDEAVYLITQEAQRQEKPVFFPLTFGFGGYLLVFSPQSPFLEEILGKKIYGNGFFERLVRNTVGDLDFMQVYQQVMKERQFIPQLGISAYITSALVVKAMLGWIEGLSMPIAPIPIVVDPTFVSG